MSGARDGCLPGFSRACRALGAGGGDEARDLFSAAAAAVTWHNGRH